MKRPIRMSMQTRKNWGIDCAVFVGAVIAGLTGIYFLFVTSGGYNGGRNAFYNVTILFGRETWEEFHLWGGLLMILAVAVHFLIHWRWVVSMTRRVVQAIKTGQSSLSSGAKLNIGIDLLIAVSFLITALSGLYFWLLTEGGYQGGSNPDWDPNFLFSRVTWDIVHTWSGADPGRHPPFLYPLGLGEEGHPALFPVPAAPEPGTTGTTYPAAFIAFDRRFREEQ